MIQSRPWIREEPPMADYPIFGDTSGTLSGTARGRTQILSGPDIPDGGPGFDIYGFGCVLYEMLTGRRTVQEAAGG